MLFNEPKLLKCVPFLRIRQYNTSFSALQRAEIAEMHAGTQGDANSERSFSALQRAEIAEIKSRRRWAGRAVRFSALQRAEIAEIVRLQHRRDFPRAFQCSSTSRNC